MSEAALSGDGLSSPHLPCPHCRVELVMSERQGVEIDYCPKCRGVWLDRGELDKIIERSALYEAGLRQAPEESVVHDSDPAGIGQAGGQDGGRFLPETPARPWGTPPLPSMQSCPQPEPSPVPGWLPEHPVSRHGPPPADRHVAYGGGHDTGHGAGHGNRHGQSHGGHRGTFLGRFFD